MKKLSRVDLYELVRDGTDVTGAQLALLNTIAWRVNAADLYSCYLSTALLVDETHYTEQILRTAAAKLEAAGLIKREKRFKRSTVYFLNVPLLTERAEVKRKKRQKERGELLNPVDPFNVRQMVLPSGDPDNTDGLDSGPDESADPAEPEVVELSVCESVDHVVLLVSTIWEDHPSLTDERSRELVKADLEECVRLAGNPRRCGELLSHLAHNHQKAFWQVSQSRKLGRYLVKMFPIWLTEHADVLSPAIEEIESGRKTFRPILG